MHQPAQSGKRGSYTANLLGNIRSHLAGLQGYDVMALELIQNADDAKAETIVFDITDDGLVVRNNGEFTYCGDLDSNPCRFKAKADYSCDFHRIAEVGSGGKLLRSENIGRFGIGFLSTYQVTDHPEVRSAGIKLTLVPESGEWFIDPYDGHGGTTFFLPWARDPNTEARLGLGVSHIGESHIDRIADDFRRVLRQSLLFLRHVHSAEVRRDGALLLGCDLDRDDESDLIVSFRPGDEVELWHILRADAAEAAKRLCSTHPQLASLDRGTEVGIGLRTDPELLPEGLLYAFLPTEQSSGLPLHINADFFPEADRKAVIFAGHQHEHAWNETLMEAAAEEIARDPEGLLRMLGHVRLWQILGKAYELKLRPSGLPACYRQLWERVKVTATQARIVQAQDGSVRRPGEVFLPPSPLTADQAKALLDAGGRLAAEELRPFQTAMGQLGAPILTLERVVGLLESTTAAQPGAATRVDEARLTSFYRPLWGILDDLIPESVRPNTVADHAVRRLRALPFVVTEDLCAVEIDRSHAAPATLDPGRIAGLLPEFAIASYRFLEFPKLRRLIGTLDLGTVVSHLRARLASEPVEAVIGVDPKGLRDLYALFADLDDHGVADRAVYESLRGLPVWRSSRGLVKATEALLPGDFTDPTGRAYLLDTSVLSGRAREFVSVKLGVKTQTIESYVETVLPTLFDDAGPVDPTMYAGLISELANHPGLLDGEGTRMLLGSLPLAPTQDGGWSRPANTYCRSEPLVKALGEATDLWLDESRVPNAHSVRAFLEGVGIRRSATARHLVDRILGIADGSPPTDDAKRASSEAFYVLCDNYDRWKADASFREAIVDLRSTACLPAQGDPENWHAPDSLYAPYRADAFRSQARILDFRNTARLKTDLLEDLRVTINPPTELVIGHLKHCMERGVGPHRSTYHVLTERADSDPLVSELAGSECIYVESQGKFLRTNQVYWAAQQLGRYAFTIPESFDPFKPLFRAIGVKDAPECSDYVDILLDLVGAHFERSAPVVDPDRTIYDACLANVVAAHGREECDLSELRRLRQAPTILSLEGMTTLPDEILLHDSEWYSGFFGGELDRALCKLPAELCPLAMELGVRRLSESASVSLEYVDGEERDENALAEKLMERTDIFARLLHDEPAAVRDRVRAALSELEAVSYDVVRIEASVQLVDDAVSAPPTPAQAFYDIEEGRLTVCRPVDDRSWAHILNAILHQLMPEAPGSEIAKLTLGVRPLMGMVVQGAHRELTDAGVPHLDAGRATADTADLASQELDELGVGDEQTDDRQIDGSAATCEDGESGADASREDIGEPSGEEDRTERVGKDAGRGPQRPNSGGTRPRKKARPKYKEQWDRRLLSYVRRKQEEASEGTKGRSASTDHNLAVEVFARRAVCVYEKARGRNAREMAQTHPGHDIVSHDPLTGEERLIEVKGVDGEWNLTGVGLSRMQFSNAQDYGDRYWLYVVEFASDPDHARIHAIRNPAMQVTSFMFDGNWREAATDERADPTILFVPGVRIHHESMGTGEILGVVVRGSTKLLTIRFDERDWDTPNVTLNLHRMRILEDGDDDDNP